MSLGGYVRMEFYPERVMSGGFLSGGGHVRTGFCPRGFVRRGLCPVLVSTISMLFRSSENWPSLLELKQCSNSD